MAQNSLTLATSGITGLTVLQDVNGSNQALATLLSGPSAPSAVGLGLTSLAGVVWHDTNGNLLKIRDQADTAWITIGSLDETGKLFAPYGLGSAGTLAYDADGTLAANSDAKIATQKATKTYVDNHGEGGKLQSVSASVAANALTVGYAGGSLDFRSATLSTGVPATVQVSALSLTVPSGATLGTVGGQQAELALLVLYNGGSPVLGIVNMAGGINLDETTLLSSTAISSGATGASTVYSTTAVTSSPFRVVGYLGITEATAGTWASASTLVQGAGGQAMGALQSLGYGQTWQNVTASRAFGATYYNTTGRPIMIAVSGLAPSSGGTVLINVDGGGPGDGSTCPGGGVSACFAIVPPGSHYVGSANGGVTSLCTWYELR